MFLAARGQSEGIRESMEQLRSEFRGQVTAVCTQLEDLKQSLQGVLKKYETLVLDSEFKIIIP